MSTNHSLKHDLNGLFFLIQPKVIHSFTFEELLLKFTLHTPVRLNIIVDSISIKNRVTTCFDLQFVCAFILIVCSMFTSVDLFVFIIRILNFVIPLRLNILSDATCCCSVDIHSSFTNSLALLDIVRIFPFNVS